MRRYLAACVMFKNEAPFLDEWLRFHTGIGFEHFYFYNNDSTDDFQGVLAPWIAAGRVTLRDWPGKWQQLPIYRDCTVRDRRDNRWIAFIDIDEFLFATETPHLPELLERYERYPGVGINWVLFGSNGHIRRPAAPVTMSYTRRAVLDLRVRAAHLLKPGGDPEKVEDHRPWGTVIKTIANPSLILQIRTPHGFRYRNDDLAVDENEVPIRDPHFTFTPAVSVTKLRLNHYWSRSLSDLRAKLVRGQPIRAPEYSRKAAFMTERKLNAVEDRTIIPLAERFLRDGAASVPA